MNKGDGENASTRGVKGNGLIDAKNVLRRVFGYKEFRGQQGQIVDQTLGGQHSLVIMPTGMGKSLCFQIPALVLAAQAESAEQPKTAEQADATEAKPGCGRGLTVVLSPLVALMKDQVDALCRKNVDATFINSSLIREQRESRYAGVSKGRWDLLYITPERFQKADFVEVIARRDVWLLAIDEAHCISQWGHDFRPDYTRVGDIRKQLGCPTTIALTATATPEVQIDIARQLDLELHQDMQLYHEGINRPNLSLAVEEVYDDDEKIRHIVAQRARTDGPGIVYFTLIRKLLEFSDRLREQGVEHLIYHGDVPRVQRRQLQEIFMASDSPLILATNAFGMGIDKENIRFVLHADLPGSIESYYQEIGRAGRDGLPSECLLLYDQRDLATQMEFIRWSNPDTLFYERVFDFLSNDLEQCNAFGLEWLREKLHHRQKHDRRLETALSMLMRWDVIRGTIEPMQLELLGEFPRDQLADEFLDNKLKRDQEKLLRIVEYVKFDGDRKEFLNAYFGVSTSGQSESQNT